MDGVIKFTNKKMCSTVEIFPQRAIIRTKSRVILSELTSIDVNRPVSRIILYDKQCDVRKEFNVGILSDDKKQIAYFLNVGEDCQIIVIDLDERGETKFHHKTRLLKIDTAWLACDTKIFSFCGDEFIIGDEYNNMLHEYCVVSLNKTLDNWLVNGGYDRDDISNFCVALSDGLKKCKFFGSDNFLEYENRKVRLTGDYVEDYKNSLISRFNIVNVSSSYGHRISFLIGEKINTYYIDILDGSTRLENQLDVSNLPIIKYGKIICMRTIPSSGEILLATDRAYYLMDSKTLIEMDSLMDIYPLHIYPEDLVDGIDKICKYSGLLKDIVNIIVEYVIIK